MFLFFCKNIVAFCGNFVYTSRSQINYESIMKEKFKFLFVYTDNTESVDFIEEKVVKAIRISEDCCLLTEGMLEDFSASMAVDYAEIFEKKLLSPEDIKIISSRLSGVRMMLKKCDCGFQISHKNIIWTAADKVENMEAYELGSGKSQFMGCHEATAGMLFKL
ncbi:MAG: hypothetical protein IJZ59_07515 [Alphaproteobacteria bacterium]|nr:hypothetical protein [Alphaproteobacteria bacterium]